jgi:AraC-like DNA-binding protein
MQDIHLYAYGRSTVNGFWQIDPSRIVSRLYFVNAGEAKIVSASREYKLTQGSAYIIPQSKSFRPVDSVGFDHTYFDFYSTRILRPDRIVSVSGDVLGAASFFSHINAVIEADAAQSALPAMRALLAGFIRLIEAMHTEDLYIASPYVMQAVNRIHSDYPSVTTKALAAELNLNESYFIRLFTENMGLSPMKYIRTVRVFRGKELIEGGAGVDEAAAKCGYSSPSAFYNAVMAELHLSPSAFKKN